NGNCAQSSQPVNIILSALKETLALFNGIVVGPNPVKDQLTVIFKGRPSEDLGFEISDISGQVVSVSKRINMIENAFVINVLALPAGSYQLTLKKGETRSVYKFIKQ
ncbi:MAG: T9SS type A sorting domain-containing protein, partial [Bacteroidia bacterium]